jgi:hypothetical protein
MALAGCFGGADAASGAPASGVEGPGAHIAFADQGTVALGAGELRKLTVVATPPARYAIDFSLLGDALDASLDRASVVAEADGHASVVLRAPDAPATFHLRAAIKNGPATELTISVSDQGFGDVRVVPVYAGTRHVTAWTASVVARTTCSALAASLPAEPPGAIVATADGSDAPLVKGAPVGPNLAVVLRAGHYAWGCTDEASLAAGSIENVKVTVVDKPIDLSTTDLDLVLAYAPDPNAYGALLGHAVDLIGDALVPPGETQGTALLDAMADALPAPDLDAFQAARDAGSWDTSLGESLSGVDLRAQVQAFVAAGLATEPHQITGHLKAVDGGVPGHAVFEIISLGSVEPEAAGVPAEHVVTWSSQPSDTVLLGGTLFWGPSRYLGALAAKQAKKAFPTAATMADGLSTMVGCDAVAAALGGFDGCDEGCLASLCADGLAARWQTALGASAADSTLGEISVSASGKATVDDGAAPTGFAGAWIGKVTDGTVTAAVQGAASGATPQLP